MIRKICNIISILLLVVLLALSVVLVVPKWIGCKTLAVLSGSMEPEIPVGSLIIIQDTEPLELEVGDIATYSMGSSMVTHRVVENHTQEQYLIFQGDANKTADASPIAYAQIEGKVWFHLPWIGYLSIYAKTPLGIAAVSGVLFLLLLVHFLPDITCEKKFA